ncbi:MAG: family 43 glycosylhydrolase [Bacteroidota bacterium]
MTKKTSFILLVLLAAICLACQPEPQSDEPALGEDKFLPAPLFIDPNYHGSCDPEVVWNPHEEAWWIFYTARKATDSNTWVGTPIGVASSKDMSEWKFRGYCRFDGVGGEPLAGETFWAPAIVAKGDSFHMFVTYKPDSLPTKNPWGDSPGQIVHYRAPVQDLLNGWRRVGVIHDSALHTIDATVYAQADSLYVWFKGRHPGEKNELFQLVSQDMYQWQNRGFSQSDVFNESVTGSGFEEAPYIFRWKDVYWLITDPHEGLFVYRSEDGQDWDFQGTILLEGSNRPLDNSRARHCSVAVVDGRAILFYHVEPWREYGGRSVAKQPLENRRSVLQAAELRYEEGKISCDRGAEIAVPD